MDGVRINLTVSGPVARAVTELAELTGLSRSAAVASYLVWRLPELRAHIDRLRGLPAPSGPIVSGSDRSGVPASSAAPSPSTAARASGGGSRMNRAERRAQAKVERKAGLR